MDAIYARKLTKFYGRTRGIEGLDISVQKGEFFGFIGPNGAGKSTTIRTLLGLISPTSGSAQILGMDIQTQRKELLKKTGYLPSEAVFYSGMRVKDILRLSADLRKTDCGNECRRLCDRLQLDPGRKIDELSFGNRKKVAIVCALQHNPELLILDEPTSGLDPLMQKEFFDILKQRNGDGTTVFLSSHILSEIQSNCTRAAIIRDGRIIACGSVGALSKTSAKRICVTGQVDLTPLGDIRDKKVSGNSVSFLYSGNISQLIRTLDYGSVTDLTITEPDLDEIFLHYYKDEEEML